LLLEETTDLLQKLSLDSQPKAVDAATEPAGAKKVLDKTVEMMDP
jgi:hypothetical protein